MLAKGSTAMDGFFDLPVALAVPVVPSDALAGLSSSRIR